MEGLGVDAENPAEAGLTADRGDLDLLHSLRKTEMLSSMKIETLTDASIPEDASRPGNSYLFYVPDDPDADVYVLAQQGDKATAARGSRDKFFAPGAFTFFQVMERSFEWDVRKDALKRALESPCEDSLSCGPFCTGECQ